MRHPTPTPYMLAMLVNAICFLCKFWAKIVYNTVYMMMQVVATICNQWARMRTPKMHKTILVEGTILYLMSSLTNQHVMLNTITTESTMHMFGYNDNCKTQLNAGSAPHTQP